MLFQGEIEDILYQGSSETLQSCVLEGGMEDDPQVPLVRSTIIVLISMHAVSHFILFFYELIISNKFWCLD